ncbi:MAG: hypothetical protein ACRENE_05490 [Polyangiaceae bacterium]
MIEVDVLPREGVERRLALPGVRRQGVENATAEGYDGLTVLVFPAEEREELRRVEEAKELLGVALGA